MQRWYSLLTIIPFALFFIGYSAAYFFVQRQEILVPNLVGKSIQDAVATLASSQIGVTLLREKEDNRVAEGIILEQVPAAGRSTRAYRSVLVTLSKRTSILKAPRCLGKSIEELESICKQRYLTPKVYFVPSSSPQNICIAQYPEPDAPIIGSEVIVYCSAGQEQLYVLPDFTTILKTDAEQFLKKLPVDVDFFEDESISGYHQGDVAKIVEQNPLAGTIFDSDQFLYIQFRVQ